jgi:hypothetical protein
MFFSISWESARFGMWNDPSCRSDYEFRSSWTEPFLLVLFFVSVLVVGTEILC